MDLLAQRPGLKRQEPPLLPPHPHSLRWENAIFAGPLLRRAHVELFEVEALFSVVHVCIFPHLSDPAPIFGFDMIGGRAQATGAFLDFSAATPAPPVPALGDAVPQAAIAGFAHRRERPDWGDIFSADFLAIRPASPGEAEAVLGIARAALLYYLQALSENPARQTDDAAVAGGQAAYVQGQRLNPHTLRMLARYTGEAAARRFIDDVLFPLPPTPRQ
jgi:hypothetical protein